MRASCLAVLLVLAPPAYATGEPGPAARSASRAIMTGAKISARRAPAGSFNADCIEHLDEEGLAADVQEVLTRSLRPRYIAEADAFFASPAGVVTTTVGVDSLYQQLAPDFDHAAGAPLTAEQEAEAERFSRTRAGAALAELMGERGRMKEAILPAVQTYFSQCTPRLDEASGDAQLIQ